MSDPACVVTFPLVSDPSVALLAWTTTPWTLPSNLGMLCSVVFMLHLMLCYVMLCYVMLCYAMLCYVILCSVIFMQCIFMLFCYVTL